VERSGVVVSASIQDSRPTVQESIELSSFKQAAFIFEGKGITGAFLLINWARIGAHSLARESTVPGRPVRMKLDRSACTTYVHLIPGRASETTIRHEKTSQITLQIDLFLCNYQMLCFVA
jgi:hypothetical protein